jgi:hypothetical protein
MNARNVGIVVAPNLLACPGAYARVIESVDSVSLRACVCRQRHGGADERRADTQRQVRAFVSVAHGA